VLVGFGCGPLRLPGLRLPWRGSATPDAVRVPLLCVPSLSCSGQVRADPYFRHRDSAGKEKPTRNWEAVGTAAAGASAQQCTVTVHGRVAAAEGVCAWHHVCCVSCGTPGASNHSAFSGSIWRLLSCCSSETSEPPAPDGETHTPSMIHPTHTAHLTPSSPLCSVCPAYRGAMARVAKKTAEAPSPSEHELWPRQATSFAAPAILHSRRN
jgi:hypothetical protein